MRDTFPTFQISNLLLDLDAEANKYVRNYDHDFDGVPEHSGAKQERKQTALKRRIAKFDKGYEQEEANFQAVSGDKFGRWRINDLDILSAALQGPTQKSLADTARSTRRTPGFTSGMTPEDITEAIMVRNGVPQHAMNSTSKSIPYMLRRQQLAARKTHELGDANGFNDAIQACHSFIEFKRLIRHVLETAGGSQLISQSSGKIGEVCSRQANVPDPELVMEVLALVNDVHMSLAAQGLHVDDQLKNAGLLLAVRCSALAAARNYLATDTEVGATKVHQINELDKSLHRLLWSITAQNEDDQDVGLTWELSQRRVAVFGLVTGQDISGHHFPRSFRTMLHSISSTGHESLKPFIHILGELGALRTMWYEFQRLSELDDRTFSVFANEFAAALMRTRHNIQNGRILLPALGLAGGIVVKAATGIFEDDCRLDLNSIIQPPKNSPTPKAPLHALPPYRLTNNHELPPNLYTGFEPDKIGGSELQGRIMDAFSQPRIDDAMSALQVILYST